jgi:hypothetical protein
VLGEARANQGFGDGVRAVDPGVALARAQDSRRMKPSLRDFCRGRASGPGCELEGPIGPRTRATHTHVPNEPGIAA